jgi:hypothetical protein
MADYHDDNLLFLLNVRHNVCRNCGVIGQEWMFGHANVHVKV